MDFHEQQYENDYFKNMLISEKQYVRERIEPKIRKRKF